MGQEASQIELTDILAEAANAQFRAADFMGPGVLRGVAPAKVNLFLGVGGVRADGRHAVATVLQALSLHDVLYVNARPFEGSEADEVAAAIESGSPAHAFGGPNGRAAITIEMVDKTVGLGDASAGEVAAIPAVDNLAYKAADGLARALGRDVSERVLIRIEKQIPSQAGLGGGSSDAACVLACLERLWDVRDVDVIESVAASLGADVPFFLQGGCALYDGAGERFVRALELGRTPVLIMKPPVGVSTAAAYAAFDATPVRPSQEQLFQVQTAAAAGEVPLFNGLSQAAQAVQPEVAAVREWLLTQEGVDAKRVLLSGSGSAFFAEMPSFSEASRLAARAKQAGFWARPTTLAALRAQAM